MAASLSRGRDRRDSSTRACARARLEDRPPPGYASWSSRIPRDCPRSGESQSGELAVEGLSSLVPIPEADEVAFLVRVGTVAKRGSTVGEEPVVEVLELPPLDLELDA